MLGCNDKVGNWRHRVRTAKNFFSVWLSAACAHDQTFTWVGGAMPALVSVVSSVRGFLEIPHQLIQFGNGQVIYRVLLHNIRRTSHCFPIGKSSKTEIAPPSINQDTRSRKTIGGKRYNRDHKKSELQSLKNFCSFFSNRQN